MSTFKNIAEAAASMNVTGDYFQKRLNFFGISRPMSPTLAKIMSSN
jgi:hypothetical protein